MATSPQNVTIPQACSHWISTYQRHGFLFLAHNASATVRGLTECLTVLFYSAASSQAFHNN